MHASASTAGALTAKYRLSSAPSFSSQRKMV
jgi:hypothetical protein